VHHNGNNNHPDSASGSGSEDESPGDMYFYLFDEESVVIEYEAPRNDDKEDRPDFLYEPQRGRIRIVEFYADWCPHCQHFRELYNSFAKRMKMIAERNKLDLEVYAVSCVPHSALCQDQDIHGYPRIKLFVGNGDKEEEGIEFKAADLHPFFVLQVIAENAPKDDNNNDLSHALEEGGDDTIHAPESKPKLGNGHGNGHGDSSSSPFWLDRTRHDIYNDAYLSFYFAMQHGIFVGRDPPSEEAKRAFRNWINMLNQVLPPAWPLQALLADLAEHLDTALESEENLLEIVEDHPPPKQTWSRSCSRGEPSMGYTCGLWELFHTATLGVVEWNANNVAGNKKLFFTPDHAGKIVRDYIEHFFACEVCRINFLHEYDNCGFDRCERLSTEIGGPEDWKELPLWLFELHNGVNLRLQKERAERDGDPPPTQQELRASEWPAHTDCPLCWHDDGRFDADAVYSFLHSTYWSDGLFLPKKSTFSLLEAKKNREEGTNWMSILGGSVLMLLLLAVACRRVQKKRKIHRTGKHKKADGDGGDGGGLV